MRSIVGIVLVMMIAPVSSTAVDPIEMILSPDRDVRSEGQERILSEREGMIVQLVRIIDDPENHMRHSVSVRKAIETLGVLRAVEGIDVLTEHIGFPWVKHPQAETPGPQIVGSGRLTAPLPELAPAVEALIAIGEPSIPKVVAKLANTNHVFERDACIAVLRRLEKRPTVRESIEAAMIDAPDKQRQRLEHALRELTREEP